MFTYENDEFYGPTVVLFKFFAVSLFSSFIYRWNLTVRVPHREWEFYALRNFKRWQRHHAKRGNNKRVNLFFRPQHY